MNKPQNPLLKLPEDQQAQIAEWMLSGMTYREVNLMVEKEFGLPRTSQFGRYASFWKEVCAPAMLGQRGRMSGLAAVRVKAAAENPAEFEAATHDAILQKAYEIAEDAKAKPKDVQAILSLVLKSKEQELRQADQKTSRDQFERELELRKGQLALDSKRVELMQRKSDAFDRAQAALTEAKSSKGGITPETLAKIESELKLL